MAYVRGWGRTGIQWENSDVNCSWYYIDREQNDEVGELNYVRITVHSDHTSDWAYEDRDAKYNDLGEGKIYFSCVQALAEAKKIVKQWKHDEPKTRAKYISIVEDYESSYPYDYKTLVEIAERYDNDVCEDHYCTLCETRRDEYELCNCNRCDNCEGNTEYCECSMCDNCYTANDSQNLHEFGDWGDFLCESCYELALTNNYGNWHTSFVEIVNEPIYYIDDEITKLLFNERNEIVGYYHGYHAPENWEYDLVASNWSDYLKDGWEYDDQN